MPYQQQQKYGDAQLWQTYRASFKDFAQQAARKDENGLEQARRAYAAARNALAESLLEKQAGRKMFALRTVKAM